MVRAPCCEKMGLKRGPWTAEEDHILVSYIQRYGHGNWRALPRQAGLLRCGKSCRLRWMNYLRPDIKRGHFTNEEEDAIINLHQLLGNRWSAIAARLPGRTDNEIKNVWHTHLKKRVKANPAATQHPKRINHNNKVRRDAVAVDMESEPILQQVAVNIIINPAAAYNAARYDEDASPAPTSPPGQYSCSDCDFSSSSTATVDDCSTSTATTTTTTGFAAETANATASSVLNYEEDYTGSSEKLLDMDESFWSEALTTLDGNSAISTKWDDLSTTASINQCYSLPDHLDQLVVGGGDFHGTDASSGDDDADFWLRVFMQAGGLPELPGF